MKLTWTAGASVATLLAVIPAHRALANTYSCDNDRDPSQYPNCSNRRIPQYQSQHQRLVLQERAVSMAPSGWSFLVECPGNTSNPSIIVLSEPNVHTGADIVRVLTVDGFTAASPVGVATSSRTGGVASEEIVDPSSCGADTAMDASVNAIQQRMLNAIDRYRDVKGNYRIIFQNNGQDDTVAFEISETTPGHYVKTTSRSGAVREHRSDGSQLASTDLATGALRVAQVGTAMSPIGPRQYFNTHCEAVFVHRQDPAGAHSASDVALPQNHAF